MNTSQRLYKLLGLSPTEQLIMQALSATRSINTIKSLTNISRTGIQYCLTSLLRRELIRTVKNGKRTNYVALSEIEIVDKIQHETASLSSQKNKKGARIKTQSNNEFVIHIGTKEIIPAYERIALEHKNERIRAIQHHRSYSELSKKLSPSQLISFNKSIISNNLIIDGMLNKSAYQAYKKEMGSDPKKYKASIKSLEGRMADYTFFPDNLFDQDAELWIFKDTSLIINWHEEVAMEITNPSITAFLKDMFEYVKKNGQKIDHNKAMKEILE